MTSLKVAIRLISSSRKSALDKRKNGGSRGAVKFFIKGYDVVVTKPSGEFVTIWPSRLEVDEVERPFSNGIKCLTWSC